MFVYTKSIYFKFILSTFSEIKTSPCTIHHQQWVQQQKLLYSLYTLKSFPFSYKETRTNLINIEFNLEELKLQKGKPKLSRSFLSPQKFLIHVVGTVSAAGRVKHAQVVFLGHQKITKYLNWTWLVKETFEAEQYNWEFCLPSCGFF